MNLDDWEDPFFEKGIDERAKAFMRRRTEEKPADRALMIDFIKPGLPELGEAGDHG